MCLRTALHCWFHRNCQLLSGVLNNGVIFLNFVGKNIVIFLLLACSLYLEFFNIPLLLGFLVRTFICT